MASKEKLKMAIIQKGEAKGVMAWFVTLNCINLSLCTNMSRLATYLNFQKQNNTMPFCFSQSFHVVCLSRHSSDVNNQTTTKLATGLVDDALKRRGRILFSSESGAMNKLPMMNPLYLLIVSHKNHRVYKAHVVRW